MSGAVLRVGLAEVAGGGGAAVSDEPPELTSEDLLDDDLLEPADATEVLSVSADSLRGEASAEDGDGRFDRFRLIGWWDQEKLSRTNALVIGAGAIGNELIKNLALLGVGRLLVADLDDIENSNLSRSVLYRAEDRGRPKAETAAVAAREIYPEMRTRGLTTDVVHDLGLGAYRWADVILGGLDNREARVSINAAAARVGKPWVDGAIERLSGVARVFDAATGPCYECTMNAVDWKMLEARRSCALLSREEMAGGKVPTTPTTSSVIAGIQAQEAVKLVHGLETLAGRGFVFDGMMHESYTVTYTQKADCPAHESYGEVTETGLSSDSTVGELLERVRTDLGPEAVVDANHDLLSGLTCPACGETEPRLGSLGRTTERDAKCPSCGGQRTPELFHTLGGASPRGVESIEDRTLGEVGVPAWDIVIGRAGGQQRAYELTGDRAAVLGDLELAG